jgi:hypothetical protein
MAGPAGGFGAAGAGAAAGGAGGVGRGGAAGGAGCGAGAAAGGAGGAGRGAAGGGAGLGGAAAGGAGRAGGGAPFGGCLGSCLGGCLGFPSGPSSSLACATTSGAVCACDEVIPNCIAVRVVVASSNKRSFVMMVWVPGKFLAGSRGRSRGRRAGLATKFANMVRQSTNKRWAGLWRDSKGRFVFISDRVKPDTSCSLRIQRIVSKHTFILSHCYFRRYLRQYPHCLVRDQARAWHASSSTSASIGRR